MVRYTYIHIDMLFIYIVHSLSGVEILHLPITSSISNAYFPYNDLIFTDFPLIFLTINSNTSFPFGRKLENSKKTYSYNFRQSIYELFPREIMQIFDTQLEPMTSVVRVSRLED